MRQLTYNELREMLREDRGYTRSPGLEKLGDTVESIDQEALKKAYDLITCFSWRIESFNCFYRNLANSIRQGTIDQWIIAMEKFFEKHLASLTDDRAEMYGLNKLGTVFSLEEMTALDPEELYDAVLVAIVNPWNNGHKFIEEIKNHYTTKHSQKTAMDIRRIRDWYKTKREIQGLDASDDLKQQAIDFWTQSYNWQDPPSRRPSGELVFQGWTTASRMKEYLGDETSCKEAIGEGSLDQYIEKNKPSVDKIYSVFGDDSGLFHELVRTVPSAEGIYNLNREELKMLRSAYLAVRPNLLTRDGTYPAFRQGLQAAVESGTVLDWSANILDCLEDVIGGANYRSTA